MVDVVDLGVRVTDSGINSAIANLENLQRKGLSTGAALDRVTSSASSMASAIERASKASNGNTLSGVDKSATAATSALSALEQEYRRLAIAQTNQSAAQRIANNLGSNPTRTLNQIATLRAAYNADPIRDAIAVEQQEQAVLAARNGKLSATAALNEAVWGTYASELNAADLALDRLTQAERAYAEASRATQGAVAASVGNRVAAGLPGAGNFRAASVAEQEAINVAIQQEAVALGRVTAARNELTAATERNTAAARTSNQAQADNSQFGYFKYLIIAGAADQAAQSILGIGQAAVQSATEQQRAFADVDRTFDGTQRQLNSLHDTLTSLSTIDPISFVDLAQIAALGNQLGIAASDIQSFTTTVAQYSTISGETADTAATAFGKIANLTALPASQFSNLGSSIEYVARTTAATESSISSTAKEISALASGAGFSADAIVGLSGALSSLSIPPERARGALSLYFGALNNAIATGGPKLQAFATITGETTDQLSALVANNQGQKVFTDFIAGLSDLNSVAKTTALKEVGLSTIRVDQTMRALAQNVPLVTKSFADANSAFEANTELSRQYAKIQATLASQFTEFQNAIANTAAAIGGVFAPELGAALTLVTHFLVAAQDFSKTPLGSVMVTIAGAVGLVVVAMLGLIGAVSLAAAGMKVIPWALTSFGAREANNSIFQFIGGMFGLNLATTEVNGTLAVTAERMTKVGGASLATSAALLELEGVTEAVAIGDAELAAGNVAVAETSVAASAGLRVMKIALASTGIGLAVVLVGTLVDFLLNAGDAAKNAAQANKDFFGGSYPSTIADGLKKDQAEYVKTGNAIQQIGTNVKDSTTAQDAWVGSLQSATGAQVALGDGTSHTTKGINDQTVAYGDNAKAALASALANSKSFQSLFKDTKANDAIQKAGFDPTAFATALLGDPVNGGKAYLAKFTKGVATSVGINSSQLKTVFSQLTGDIDFSRSNKGAAIFNQQLQAQGIHLSNDQLAALQKLKPAYETVATAVDASSAAIKKSGATVAAQEAANKALQSSTAGVGDGFVGATVTLSDYQDAVQTGLQTTLGFSNVLNTLGSDISKIKLSDFGKGLSSTNDAAVKFFGGLQQLASNGQTSFAAQLAAVGPSAQGILSQALKASPTTQAALEEDARFAAFLASDAFKTAFAAQMQTSNNAYAQIFKATGNLNDVKGYIAAQVAGTGAEYEKQWDLQHPEFKLNVEFQDPTADQLSQWSQQNDGKLKVTATVLPVLAVNRAAEGTQGANKFTDTSTGASITLPASLDGKALSASLAYWEAHEGQTPQQIAAALNTGNFSSDINSWITSHGPIPVQVTVDASTSSLNALNAKIRATLGLNAPLVRAKGGGIPGFATGGSPWGLLQGPGTTTSDSMLVRASRGEYFNNAESVKFWGGESFFDSLNRKTIPASFAAMLGAAAVSGNSGPSHVAHVQLVQNNPVTRDSYAQLRETSENVAAGIWGD